MTSLKIVLKLMLLVFVIMSTGHVRTAHGIEKAQEANNVENKGNELEIYNTQGIRHAHGIGTAQLGGPPVGCCVCGGLLPCCPCPSPV